MCEDFIKNKKFPNGLLLSKIEIDKLKLRLKILKKELALIKTVELIGIKNESFN